jgi:hypothetical protein
VLWGLAGQRDRDRHRNSDQQDIGAGHGRFIFLPKRSAVENMSPTECLIRWFLPKMGRK